MKLPMQKTAFAIYLPVTFFILMKEKQPVVLDKCKFQFREKPKFFMLFRNLRPSAFQGKEANSE